MTAILAGNQIIPLEDITGIDITDIERGSVVVSTPSGNHTAEGFHAIEAVMAIKPSALEGRRLRWRKGAWWVHNVIGHPGMQLLAWLGYPRAGMLLHERTTPRPTGFR